MFEDLDALGERLLATAPDQDDPYEPTLDPDGKILARIVLLERLKSATDAELMMNYARLSDRAETWQNRHDPKRDGEVGPEDLVSAEIAPALHLAPVTASLRVSLATQIVTRLPGALKALRRGDLDMGRVRAILEATMPLSDADAGKIEQVVLPAAVDQTAGELRSTLRRAVITVDPTAAEKRRKEAIQDRAVWTPQGQGLRLLDRAPTGRRHLRMDLERSPDGPTPPTPAVTPATGAAPRPATPLDLDLWTRPPERGAARRLVDQIVALVTHNGRPASGETTRRCAANGQVVRGTTPDRSSATRYWSTGPCG